MAMFRIVVRTEASLHPDGEPSEYVSEYSGLIVCADDAGAETRVGRVHAYRIHAGLACNAGEPLFDVCDAHSEEMHEVHTLLYEPEGYQFHADLVDGYEAFEPDVLVVDYVVLAPKWRKMSVGLLAVRKLVDMLGGGCGLVVSHIAPLRRDAAPSLRVPVRWLPGNRTKQERREAAVKLRRYFRRMGFRRLGRTKYYALSMHQVTPDAWELLGFPPEGE